MEQIQKNRKKANYTLIRVCSFVTALGLTIAAPFFIKVVKFCKRCLLINGCIHFL